MSPPPDARGVSPPPASRPQPLRPAPSSDPPRSAGEALRRLGQASLWLILIAVVVWGAVQVASLLSAVVLPTFLALVLATLLEPPARWLREHGWRAGVAAFAVLVAFLLLFGGVAAWVVPAVGGQLGQLEISLTGGLDEVEALLVEGPLPISADQVEAVVGRLEQAVRDNLGTLAQDAVSGATLILQVLAGLLLALVVLFFFLKDGDRMWRWVQELAPVSHREDVQEAGRRSWEALSAFLRAQTFIALFDATFIGLALIVMDVPLALPLIVLTFFAAYVPYIGAISAGAAAVLVALVASGLTTALIVLGAILVVQQLEGNVIQPLVMGHALSVHPVVILLGVVAGTVLAGILGAIIATPLLAAASGVFSFWRERHPPLRDDGGAA